MKLIKFSASWCMPCKQLSKTLEKVLPDYPQVEFIEYDVEDNEDKTEDFSIRNLPTMVILDDQDTEISRITGSITDQKIREFIDQAL